MLLIQLNGLEKDIINIDNIHFLKSRSIIKYKWFFSTNLFKNKKFKKYKSC